MTQVKEEFKTIKEWCKITGLKLYNYDGYVDIYLELTGQQNSATSFYETQTIRNRDAGNLLCTRRGFESGLRGCTIRIPEISDYEQLSDYLPNFIESEINIRLSLRYGQLKTSSLNEDINKDYIKDLLKLIKLKVIAREKNIKINNSTEQKSISKLQLNDLTSKEKLLLAKYNLLTKFNGTIEDFEIYLTNKIIESLEKTLTKTTMKIANTTLIEIKLLTSILYQTARWESKRDVKEEFIYLDLLDQKDTFEQTYNIIDDSGIESGTIFRYQMGNTSIGGVVPSQQESDDDNKPKTPKR